MKFIRGLLTKNEVGIIGVSRESAIYSFVIGTAIFLLFLLTHSDFFIILGLIFTIVAIIIGLSFLVSLTIKMFIEKEKRKPIVVSIFLVVLNIPIAILYYYKVLAILVVGGE